jgi:hypothetical protein
MEAFYDLLNSHATFASTNIMPTFRSDIFCYLLLGNETRRPLNREALFIEFEQRYIRDLRSAVVARAIESDFLRQTYSKGVDLFHATDDDKIESLYKRAFATQTGLDEKLIGDIYSDHNELGAKYNDDDVPKKYVMIGILDLCPPPPVIRVQATSSSTFSKEDLEKNHITEVPIEGQVKSEVRTFIAAMELARNVTEEVCCLQITALVFILIESRL